MGVKQVDIPSVNQRVGDESADKDPEIQRQDSLQGCFRTLLASLSWIMTEDLRENADDCPQKSALVRLLAYAAPPTPPSSPRQGVCGSISGTGFRFIKEAIILLLTVTIKVCFQLLTLRYKI